MQGEKGNSLTNDAASITEICTENKHSTQISSNLSTSHSQEIECSHQPHGQPEIALLRAIILQAIVDRVNNSKRTEDKVAKVDAVNWFDLKNKDFQLICDLAGWSCGWVIEATENALKSPEKWRRNQGRYN